MTSPAFDLPAAEDERDTFFDTAARIAAQIATPPAEPVRRASYLRLEGDVLTAIAEYDETGEIFRGRYELPLFPNFERAVMTGTIQVIGLSEMETSARKERSSRRATRSDPARWFPWSRGEAWPESSP